jgi:hypothetical protein
MIARPPYSFLQLCLAFLLALAFASHPVAAQTNQQNAKPKITTNQSYIEDVTARSDLDIKDLNAVFAHVFASLPEKLKVYPTENYYYFRFHHDGIAYAGNIRLDTTERKKGLVNFAYFPAETGWRQDEINTFRALGADDGVKLEELNPLLYRVTYRGKAIEFQLNDLSGVQPPEGVVGKDEEYLGPIFDESGIQFYFIYHKRLKMFMYVLNEAAWVPDELYTSKESDRIIIGRRTGFAYFRDEHVERKILIGVYDGNVVANTWFDGPFDQLPDNFMKGEAFRDAIVDAGIATRDEVSPLGLYAGDQDRVLITPYTQYKYTGDLKSIADCAADKTQPVETYYECFVIEDTDDADTATGSTEPDAGTGTAPAGTPAGKAPTHEPDEPASKPEKQGALEPLSLPIVLANLSTTRPAVTPGLRTNQEFIEELLASRGKPLGDMDQVFDMVFSRLPASVKVYPTENYYYFYFTWNGMDYSGNFRLAVSDRDEGKIHFAYYPTYNGWRREEVNTYKLFTAADGVKVSKAGDFSYQVSSKNHTVEFVLNDLRNDTPPKGVIREGEVYIGPVFDESAIRFHLVYNKPDKVFHYILNENGKLADELYTSEVSPRILLGRRSGFAFYRDKNVDRKILIGVFAESSNVNGPLDGPFDQLPDNFLKGDVLQAAMIDHEPDLKGNINRYGYWPGGDSRFLIGPYLYFYRIDELARFDTCATSDEMKHKRYYSCFHVEDPDAQ